MRHELELMHKFFLTLAPLPDAEWEHFKQTIQIANLVTGQKFISAGDQVDKVAFVIQGLLKSSYITLEGDEYIQSFSAENTYAMPFTDYLSGSTRSQITITALEPTTIIESSFLDYPKLLTRHWTWQQIGRILAERGYMQRERRQFQLLTMQADARLEAFIKEFPGLSSRVSQKDLAAYLGITPVSLSRVRAQRNIR